MSQEEQQTRIELAASYRLVAHFGWDDLIYTHISAKIPGTETFLINQYGLRFDEITASSLVKVDINGNVIGRGVINPAGFVIHGTIHQARPDAQCIVHTHTPEGIAVSADQRGLLPISQASSFIVKNIAYHDYYGIVVDDEEREILKNNLGDKHYLMLRNHGLLTVGETVAIATMNMYSFHQCCKIQTLTDLEHVSLISDEVLSNVGNRAMSFINSLPEYARRRNAEWQALLRLLDAKDSSYKE
jgi:ribulose-5-phosphate 4-epimerase/fuculose-1-phosphate aldolase